MNNKKLSPEELDKLFQPLFDLDKKHPHLSNTVDAEDKLDSLPPNLRQIINK